MGKKKSVPEYQQTAVAPTFNTNPGTTQTYNIPNSSLNVNGQIASMSFDPNSNTFTQSMTPTTAQRYANDQQNALLNSSFAGANAVLNSINDPEQRDQYVNDLFNPAKRELDFAYDRQLGQAVNNANTKGTLDSLSFQDYATNQAQKNYANSVADLMSKSRIQSYQLPSLKLAPYIDAASMAQSGIDSASNNNLALLQLAMQGQNQGNTAIAQQYAGKLDATNLSNNLAQQSYANQVAADAARNAYNLNKYQLNQANSGFFSRLF